MLTIVLLIFLWGHRRGEVEGWSLGKGGVGEVVLFFLGSCFVFFGDMFS